MSLDIEQRLRAFLASAPQTIHAVATLEISHSAMNKTYHLWRETYAGQTTTETGVVTMQPASFDIRLAGTSNHLDQKFDISLSLVDSADEFRQQMDRIPVSTKEKVRIVYREYLSDDLSSIQSQAALQVESVSYTIGGATISAVSPRLNLTRTGELYTPKTVPMLRGFL